MNAFDSRKVDQTVIKYAVQRQIFCKSCGQILDMRRAVLTTFSVDKASAGALCTCGDCFDSKIKPSIPSALAALALRFDGAGIAHEVTDGREAFKAAPRNRKVVTP